MAVSVKDFLDAIRGRYQDEANKVEVTGSIAENFKEVSFTLQEGPTILFVGENADINPTILDISNFKNIMIWVKNDTNGTVRFNRLRFFDRKTGLRNDANRIDDNDALEDSIPSGASKLYTAEMENLSYLSNDKTAYISAVVELTKSSITSGDVTVIFFGGV